MDKFSYLSTLGLLLLFAICHGEAMATIWSYITIHNGVGHYILTELSESIWFWPVLFSHDLIVNVLLILLGAVLVALFSNPTHGSYAIAYGVMLYFWTHHYSAVGFGFPIFWNPTIIFSSAVFLVVPFLLIKFIQRGTHAAA